MKNIGYYAGFLTTEQQEEINNYSIDKLTRLLCGWATELDIDNGSDEAHESDLLCSEYIPLKGDLDKVALIRGLCDRIELKLMETAT